MLVRAYQPPNGCARIVHPNARHRKADETDAAFLERTCVRAEAADPTLAGLPTADLDIGALPAERERPNPAPDELAFDVRAAWRVTGGTVTVLESAVKPKRRL